MSLFLRGADHTAGPIVASAADRHQLPGVRLDDGRPAVQVFMPLVGLVVLQGFIDDLLGLRVHSGVDLQAPIQQFILRQAVVLHGLFNYVSLVGLIFVVFQMRLEILLLHPEIHRLVFLDLFLGDDRIQAVLILAPGHDRQDGIPPRLRPFRVAEGVVPLPGPAAARPKRQFRGAPVCPC